MFYALASTPGITGGDRAVLTDTQTQSSAMKPKAASYYKQNRLKQLRAFCHAATTGSISRAADQLYLSQPSVSLQIQALERELNTMLFEKTGT